MKTVIDTAQGLNFNGLDQFVISELTRREGNKNFIYNKTPFVRVSCIQTVGYEGNSEASYRIFGGQAKVIDGFTFTFDSSIDDLYGESQVIGKTIGFRNDPSLIRIKNPRRVPPIRLSSFEAVNGESARYYTTATLNFTCNSLEQLEFITPFLLRPGNSIFVEWGNNVRELNNVSFFNASDIDLLKRHIKPSENEGTVNQQGFIERFNKNIKAASGNYEFIYGIVSDFNINLNSNLGYDCSVSLISTSLAKYTSKKDNAGTGQKEKTNTNDKEVASFRKTLPARVTKLIQLLERKYPIEIINFSNGGKYITLYSIIKFLNGDYEDDDEQVTTSLKPLSLESKIAENIPIDATGDPVYSYDKNLLIFRTNMPRYSLNEKLEVDYVDDINLGSFKELAEISITPDGELSNIGARYTGGEERVSVEAKFNTSFKSTKFKIIDSQYTDDGELITSTTGTWGDEKDYLQNCYINVNYFKNMYVNSDLKIMDILHNLIKFIDDATNRKWDLNILKQAVAYSEVEGSDQKKEEVVAKVASFSTATVSNQPTYTFKLDSKNSIVETANWDLNLSGALGDYIYMQSLSGGDGTADSEKVKSLIFNLGGVTVVDKRNEFINDNVKFTPPPGSDSDSSGNDGGSSINEIVPPPIDDYIRANFFGKPVISEYKRSITVDEFIKALEDEISNLNKLDDSKYGRLVEQLNISGLFKKDSVEFDVRGTVIDANKGDEAVDIADILSVSIEFVTKDLTVEDLRVINTYVVAAAFKRLLDLEYTPLVYSNAKEKIEADDKKRQEEKSESNKNSDNPPPPAGINPLLDAKLELTMTGIGGIDPLNFFRAKGLQSRYTDDVDYCVMNVAHNVNDQSWKTSITGRVRRRTS